MQDKCFTFKKLKNLIYTQEQKKDGESLHDLVKHEITKTPDVVYICRFRRMKMHFQMLVLTLKKCRKVTIRAFIIKMWLFHFNVPIRWFQ